MLIKVQSTISFDITLNTMLNWEQRTRFNNTLFIAKDFLDFCIWDAIAMIFVTWRVVGLMRIIPEFNTVVLTLSQSSSILATFMFAVVMMNAGIVPMAMGIWGTLFEGYTTFWLCLNSTAMIAYSKGELAYLLDTNPVYSIMFMLIYYFMLIFVMHAGFHMA